MTFPRWPRSVRRWLFPLLVSCLVLGHACELPAYAGLIGDHAAPTGDVTPAGHDHDGDDQAIGCDAVLVIPAQGVEHPSPGLVMAMPAPPQTTLVPRLDVAIEVRPAKPSTGPPLFLLFSSLLI